jgi:D-alanyl-D-alanine dipeptidase
MYSRPDNFTGHVLYGDLRQAYLHPKAAKALARAQRLLQKEHPELSLIVFDAARPMHIQQKMWNAVKHTPKYFYVSNPAHGG